MGQLLMRWLLDFNTCNNSYGLANSRAALPR